MADNDSQESQDQNTVGMPVRLVRGEASPEELAALVAVLASVGADAAPDPANRRSPASGRTSASQWSAPGRMVRVPHAHGPGGWQASALPR